MSTPHDHDNGNRSRGPFQPLEMLDDIQQQAFDAAMRVAGELTALTGDLAGSQWLDAVFGRNGASPGSNTGTDNSDDDPLDVGRLRTDVARAAETFGELMRTMLDVGFDALDELARRPKPRPSASTTRGASAYVRCTVRNPNDVAATGARPHVPQLVSDRAEVLGGTLTVTPASLDLEPLASVVVDVAVDIPDGAAPGRYHGLLLVEGVPDIACPIVIDVAPPDSQDDGG